MDREDQIMLGILLVLALLLSCSVCNLSISIVSADEMPPLYIRYMLPAIYNEPRLPVFPPCPTPIPGEPIVC